MGDKAVQGETLGSARGGVPVWLVIGGAVVGLTLGPAALHYRAHGVVNTHQLAMAFFFGLNVIIALWELCLFARIDRIRERYEEFLGDYRGREFDRVKDFFFTRISLRQVVSIDTWAEVWASYALFDESYSNKKSFGFFIDVGNGFTTLVPSLLFVAGITFDLLPARALGLITLLISYQMFYGTLVYLSSYILNERYRGFELGKVALFVGISNGLWGVFPVWAMWLAVHMIYTDSFALLR